jgi:putative redox protein
VRRESRTPRRDDNFLRLLSPGGSLGSNSEPGACCVTIESMPDKSTEATPHAPTLVTWTGGLQFEASRDAGPRIHIDGDAKQGPSPVDVLLSSLATCAATDVVTILQKQRTPPTRLDIRVESTRVNTIPRRLASVVLHFRIEGAGILQAKADRAVELAVTKYCSVRSSLSADISVTWTVELA